MITSESITNEHGFAAAYEEYHRLTLFLKFYLSLKQSHHLEMPFYERKDLLERLIVDYLYNNKVFLLTSENEKTRRLAEESLRVEIILTLLKQKEGCDVG